MTQSLLLVDDDPVVLAVTQVALRSPRRVIRCAYSGEEALELLARRPADVVVLDVDMPGLSGWETLSAIRADPRLRDTRVVLYTAASLETPPVGGPEPDGIVAKQAAIRHLVDAVNAPPARL